MILKSFFVILLLSAAAIEVAVVVIWVAVALAFAGLDPVIAFYTGYVVAVGLAALLIEV
jgi:hypothetical protein